MNVSRNVTFFAGQGRSASGGCAGNAGSAGRERNTGRGGDTGRGEGSEKAGNSRLGGRKNLTFHADGLDNLKGRILQKKREARKKAMKAVNDAWNGDRAIDRELDESRRQARDSREQMGEARSGIAYVIREQEMLREQYDVAPDSQEQKGLELLKKYQESLHPGSGVTLTREEYQSVEEIKAKGITEYQLRCLDWERHRYDYEDMLEDGKKNAIEEGAVIAGVRREKLKSNPMETAREQAEDIMAAAGEEIIGMVIEEAKEHMEEEQEERDKEAEKLKEEREEEEARLEKLREEKKEKEDETIPVELPAEDLVLLERVQEKVDRELQDIFRNVNLVAEEIKGSLVDRKV